MYVVGLDIGYSNVKTVYGDAGGRPKSAVIPAGAAPAQYTSETMISKEDDPTKSMVTVNGKQWVAGVPLNQIEGWVRDVHDSYPATDTYYALFLSAISSLGRGNIDHLVTGLPVFHYRDEEMQESLVNRLKGDHVGLDGKSFHIEEVSVVPQPVGAYMDLASTFDDQELIEEGRILVIDPGYFSVDWITMEGMQARMSSSGTSLKAMSKLIESAVKMIEENHGSGVSVLTIENALRAGKSRILHYGNRVDITQYLEKAAMENAGFALTALKSSTRENTSAVDIVLLTGGGANLYRSAAEEAFPRSRIITPDEPVTSNANGFWFLGI